MVLVGTTHQWAAWDEHEWVTEVRAWGAAAAAAGVEWMTVRPVGGPPIDRHARHESGPCPVLIDPRADGRQRLATALAGASSLDEAEVSRVLNAPAPSDPDLIVVCGPQHRLPPSVVWELAYAELVFVDIDPRQLGVTHLLDAVAEFARRHRRFGGLD